MKERLRIGVWTDAVGCLGRGVLEGVSRYALEQGRWQVVPSSMFMLDRTPSWSEGQIDGLVIQLNQREWIGRLRRAPFPVVNVSEVMDVPDLPRVVVDNHRAGELAAEHFLERGYRHFAFVGSGAFYAEQRYSGFAGRLAERGFDARRSDPIHGQAQRDRPVAFDRLAGWVASLPRPVAMFCANDLHALDVLEACLHVGVSVPEHAAVLGMDDDPLACRIARVALSSVQTPAQQIGYEATRVLHAMLGVSRHRRKASPALIRLPPPRIVTRASTDIQAVDDRALSEALRFIRQHEGDPIGVEDVAQAVGLSRRTIERRFGRLLGRSPLEQIRRAHVERAKRLLTESDWDMPRVAQASGFCDASYFGATFRRFTGTSPTRFRSQCRGR